MKLVLERRLSVVAIALISCLVASCGETPIFPIWPPLIFDEQPAVMGPYGWTEFRVEVPDGADGEPTGITVFEPSLGPGADPAPVVVWVLGSNVQSYYQQSLHETLASWGYAVIINDGRLLTLTDFEYHRRTVDLAKQTLELGLAGDLTKEVELDPERIGVGGYSIGGTLAVFMAAETPAVDAIVGWAPSSSPFWTGIRPNRLYPRVTQSLFMLIGELDIIAPPDGFPAELAESLVNASSIESVVVEGAIHTQFQQPIAIDSQDPITALSRFDQQAIAITKTREYLEAALAPTAP